jgi:hypothetical protein
MTRETASSHIRPSESKAWRGRSAAGVIAGAALALAACESGGTPHDGPTSAHADAPTSVLASPGASPDCTLVNGVREASLRTENGHVQLSSMIGTGLSLGKHDTNGECYERAVLRLGGDADKVDWPGVSVRYVEPPILGNPSDRPIDIPGNAFLQITTGDWMYAQGGGIGPVEMRDQSLDVIQDVVLTQNSEGVSTWTVGLTDQRDFTLSEVSHTPDCQDLCIVIDIQDSRTP